jgi:hypothetical protein
MTKDQIKQQINAVVDRWVNDTISSLTTGKPGVQPRGIWDRLKGTFYNLRYGREDQKNNPYYWRNRFGDEMGAQESQSPIGMTLSEYNILRSAVGATERVVNEVDSSGVEKLRLVQVIRRAAEDLKSRLHSILDSWETPDAASAPETSPAPKTAPISPEPGEEEPATAGTAQTASTAQSAPEDNPASIETDPAAGTKTAGKDATKSKEEKQAEQITKIKKGIRDAIEARNSDLSKLKPQTSWLSSGGKIISEKMPWVIAWISTTDVEYDDASVETVLQNKDRVGEKFASRFDGLSWKITGQNGTLIRNFRRSLPGISDKDFNKILSELTKGEIVDSNKLPGKTSTVAQEDTTKKKTRRKKSVATNPPPKKGDQQTVASQETQKEPASVPEKKEDEESKTTVADQEAQKDPAGSATEEDPEEKLRRAAEEKKQDLLKTLYEGKNTKEIIAKIKEKLLAPAYNFLGKDASVGKRMAGFMDKLRIQFDNNNEPLTAADGSPLIRQEEQDKRESLIVIIKNGDLLNGILKLTGPKIQESDLIGFLN